MDNNYFKDTVKKLCKRNNITVKKLLEEININRNFFYDMQKRDVKPSIESIEKIADYLNVSIDYLVGRTDKPDVNR